MIMAETDSASENVTKGKVVKPLKKLRKKYNDDRLLFKATKYLRSVMKRRKVKCKNKKLSFLYNAFYPLSIEPCHEHLENLVGNESGSDPQVQLRCRQLSGVVSELRKSILQQDWDNTRILLTILCHSGLKFYSHNIIRTCFLMLFNHPKSSKKLLDDFIKVSTGYILDEDVDKFIRILFALRQKELPYYEPKEYSKRWHYYKVTQDPEFEAL